MMRSKLYYRPDSHRNDMPWEIFAAQTKDGTWLALWPRDDGTIDLSLTHHESTQTFSTVEEALEFARQKVEAYFEGEEDG